MSDHPGERTAADWKAVAVALYHANERWGLTAERVAAIELFQKALVSDERAADALLRASSAPPEPPLQPIAPEWAEAANFARGLCESEAMRWERTSPKTAEHWHSVATRLGALYLTQDHLGVAAPQGPDVEQAKRCVWCGHVRGDDRLLAIASLVNGYHNGAQSDAPGVLRAIADALGPPFERSPEPPAPAETVEQAKTAHMDAVRAFVGLCEDAARNPFLLIREISTDRDVREVAEARVYETRDALIAAALAQGRAEAEATIAQQAQEIERLKHASMALDEWREGLRRFISGVPPGASTDICEEPSYGYGDLDNNGFWQYPIHPGLVRLKREFESSLAERDRLKAELELRRRQMSRFPFCADHRDKVFGHSCYACRVEQLELSALKAQRGTP